jgi:hypothetical protein
MFVFVSTVINFIYMKQLVLFYYNNKSFIASHTAVLYEANLHFDFNRLLNCYLEIKM